MSAITDVAVPPGTACQHCVRLTATRGTEEPSTGTGAVSRTLGPTGCIPTHYGVRSMSGNWSGRHVLVTGGRGFLGSAVLRALAARGCGRVSAPTSEDFDLRRREDADAMIAELAPDVVIHLAAKVGGIGANMERPGDLYLDNLLMGTFVLDATRRADTPKTVMIGTICSYPKFTPVPFREDSLWQGYPEETNAPYGLAKKMLLVQSQTYRQQYGFNAIYLLPVNLYGPRDNFDPESSHVIPALIRKCILAKKRGDGSITVWGDGSPTREFLYVEDAAKGILLAAERYNSPAPVNLGSAHELSIKQLVELIARLTGFEGTLVWDTSQPNGQPRRKLDTTRAEREFGFVSQTRFEEGLRRTIDWYVASQREDLSPELLARSV